MSVALSTKMCSETYKSHTNEMKKGNKLDGAHIDVAYATFSRSLVELFRPFTDDRIENIYVEHAVVELRVYKKRKISHLACIMNRVICSIYIYIYTESSTCSLFIFCVAWLVSGDIYIYTQGKLSHIYTKHVDSISLSYFWIEKSRYKCMI